VFQVMYNNLKEAKCTFIRIVDNHHVKSSFNSSFEYDIQLFPTNTKMSGVVNVFVSSPDTHSERRIDPHITVAQFKGKLELITGIPASNQAISILASENDPRLIAELTDDSKLLGYYGIADWQLVKVSKMGFGYELRVEFMIPGYRHQSFHEFYRAAF